MKNRLIYKTDSETWNKFKAYAILENLELFQFLKLLIELYEKRKKDKKKKEV